jgi:hypothetical protein
MAKGFILLRSSESDILRSKETKAKTLKEALKQGPRIHPRRTVDFRLHEEDKRRLRQVCLTRLTLTDRRKQVEKYL